MNWCALCKGGVIINNKGKWRTQDFCVIWGRETKGFFNIGWGEYDNYIQERRSEGYTNVWYEGGITCFGCENLWKSYPPGINVLQSSKMSLKLVKFNFNFFDWLIVYIICKATFYSRLHWNWSIGSKDTDSWIIANTKGNKEIICSLLHLKISICEFQLDHTTNNVCSLNNDEFKILYK